MLNFKNKHRSNGVVFLNFSTGEFSQKPIKYWSNVGIVHKHSTFIKFVKTIKKMCGDNTMNNISRLYYYAGARITFPFHVHWMEIGLNYASTILLETEITLLKFQEK